MLPRPTHQWLKPLLDVLDGVSGVRTSLGAPTSVHGFYGATGLATRIATGGALDFSATFLGASGFGSTGLGASGLYTHLARFADNGGTGTPYTHGDVVAQLKNMGILPK